LFFASCFRSGASAFQAISLSSSLSHAASAEADTDAVDDSDIFRHALTHIAKSASTRPTSAALRRLQREAMSRRASGFRVFDAALERSSFTPLDTVEFSPEQRC